MDKCKSESLLADNNIKVTKQRLSVLDLIISIEGSFCADDLYTELKGKMDLVTIYRNLMLLCNEGILRQVMNKNDRQYFEIACVHNPAHPHFFCSICRKIYCLKSGKNFNIPKKINPGDDFVVHETILQYTGICPACRK
jgi:Fur family ferric uptake transcriptional regulator